MKLAIIPARGGSKRIPRKNIKAFNGQPIIAYAINAARQSGCFDQIIVSTDDEEIAQVAKNYGASVPFKRPAELADDWTTTTAVIKHAIEWITAHQAQVDLACCIYATAPFLRASDLLQGMHALNESSADFAIGVTRFAFPIQRAVRVTPLNRLEMFNPEHQLTRSQDLEEAYHDAGQFYWGRAPAFLKKHNIFSDATIPVILPRYRVEDIDTPEDWTRAEIIYQSIALAEHIDESRYSC